MEDPRLGHDVDCAGGEDVPGVLETLTACMTACMTACITAFVTAVTAYLLVVRPRVEHGGAEHGGEVVQRHLVVRLHRSNSAIMKKY